MPRRRSADLDALRAAYPHLGFGVYALSPDDPITLEVLTPDGDVHAVTAPTLAEALALAFPAPPDQTDVFG